MVSDKPADVTDLRQQPHPAGRKVACCWVGSWPAHYTRALHRRIEAELPGRMAFIFLDDRGRQQDRLYERGDLTEARQVVPRSSPMSLIRALESADPASIVVAGNYPRLLLVAMLWAAVRRRHVAYASDTNVLDALARRGLSRYLKVLFHRTILGAVGTYFYIGTRNRDYYNYIYGRRGIAGRLAFLPYAAVTADRISDRIPADPASGQGLRVLYLGRIAPEKNVESLIRALERLSPHTRDRVKVTIVGDGAERARLEVLARAAGVAHCVSFVGSVSSDAVYTYYAQSDLFVLPSSYEPWGLVVNEALSAGVPVAAPFWVGAVADIVIDGHSGIVMEDNAPSTIAASIERALALGPDGLRAMGANGRQLVQTGGFCLDGATRALSSFVRRFDS